MVGQTSLICTQLCLAVAIRYSLSRTQWGDRPIMTYVTHQRRLIPGLAAVYALQASSADPRAAFPPRPARAQRGRAPPTRASAPWLWRGQGRPPNTR